MDKKNIESIFPLTSIQKGLLFHALKDGEAGGYTGRPPNTRFPSEGILISACCGRRI